MPRKRTTTDKPCHRPIDVELGGKHYKVEQLPIKGTTEWLGKYGEYMSGVANAQSVNLAAASPHELTEGLTKLMCHSPVQMVNIFFEYARNLAPVREEIEERATHWEIFMALEEIMSIANPLLAVGRLMQVQAGQDSRSSTNTMSKVLSGSQ